MYVHRYRCYDAAVDPFFLFFPPPPPPLPSFCANLFSFFLFFFCFSLITVSFCVVTFPYQIKNEQRIK
ncbi:hypothetical protein VTP01DRAFT_8214 [Rhizomucor pusillus]|uniref:uncharacterized protein n=1 Tax=Rhizomucor pusillus TaxID=4840 RepID=UPI00374263AE